MEYLVELDNISEDVWNESARRFLDHTIYQTWAYQCARAKNDTQRLSQILIRTCDGEPKLMAIVRINRIPLLGLRVGYVQWGPLFNHRLYGQALSRGIWELLRDSYIPSHVDVLRVVPNQVKDETGNRIVRIISQSGFSQVEHVKPYHSIYVSVDGGEAAIRNAFHRSWRRTLKKAESTDIEVKESRDLEYFNILEEIYTTARKRKGFNGLDPRLFIQTQQDLHSSETMRIILAYSSGDPVCAHASSYLGEMGEGILAASTKRGLALNSSYLVWWKTLLAAHQAGMRVYNLGGIDPKDNPSVYQFKMRMGGKEVYHIGAFDATRSLLTKKTWRCIEKVYRIIGR